MAGSDSIGLKVTFGPLGPRLRRGYDPQVPGGTGTRSARDPRGGYTQISGAYYAPDTACNFPCLRKQFLKKVEAKIATSQVAERELNRYTLVFLA